MRFRFLTLGLLFAALATVVVADSPRNAKEALGTFSDLIGSWRGTGTPVGSRAEQQKGFWTETMTWQWQFKGDDAWLKVAFDKSKHFASGELRFSPMDETYALTLRTLNNEEMTYRGAYKDKNLTLERQAQNEAQRLVFTLLHENRFLYRYEVKPQGKSLFTKVYGVGATKEGVPFAAGDGKPECIVSGGVGTLAVTHMGKTYYVCCSGCRDEFRENPDKYIKEFEAKKKTK
jgi:hypothetical protein